jgi:undecaprenyl diphosphate synthase
MFERGKGHMVNHLACIMDGNRRWAKAHGLMPWDGHIQAISTIRLVVDWSLEKGIKHLSLYTFSLENFNRSDIEKKYLFSVAVDKALSLLLEYVEKGVRVSFIGDRSFFPESIIEKIVDVEQRTFHGDALQIYLLFCYGGRQEIVSAVNRIACDIAKGALVPEQVNEEVFRSYLWSGKMPDPEIIVRTGNCMRLSNFLTYQSTYSELFFLHEMWPDLTRDHLDDILSEYASRKRNFGK